VLVWLGLLYLSSDIHRHALDDVDGLYTTVARGMHNWGTTPYVDGVRFLDKPPALYWAMAASYSVFGVSEWAGRLPLTLAVLLTAFLLSSAAARSGDPTGGLWGALVFGLSAGPFLFTRTIEPGTLLVFFETLAFWAFLEWRRGGKSTAAFLFYLALAGATLSKGLVGAVLPLGAVAFFLLSLGRLRGFLEMEPVRGPALFLVVVCPWFVTVARENPGFLHHFFVEEHVLRFFGARVPHDYSSLPIPVFWALVLVWLLPFTPLLADVPPLLREGGDLVRLSVSWSLFGLVFFSLSSRLEHYAFTFLPPLGLLLGLAAARFVEEGRRPWGMRVCGYLSLVIGFLLAGGSFFLPRPQGLRHLDSDTTDFGPLFHLPAPTIARLGALALVAGVALGLGGALVLALPRRSRLQSALALAGTASALCGLSARALLDCEDSLSSHVFGEELARLARPSDRVFVMGDFETANSVLVDAPIPLLVFDGQAAVLEWGLRFADAPRRVFTRNEFLSAFRGEGRVFVLLPVEQIPGLGLPRSYELLRSAGRALVSNAPP
jgi:4-amino-4-deoxy-L-arabinose transferase-like glycosyltransferase